MQYTDLIENLRDFNGWGITDEPASVLESVSTAETLREERDKFRDTSDVTALQAALAHKLGTAEITVADAVKELTRARRAAEDNAAALTLLRMAIASAEREALMRFKALGPDLLPLLRPAFNAALEDFVAGNSKAYKVVAEMWALLDRLREGQVIVYSLQPSVSPLELRYRRPDLVPNALSPTAALREAIAAGATPALMGPEDVRKARTARTSQLPASGRRSAAVLA